MEDKQLISELLEAFVDKFGSAPQHLFHSPGRVNLIGEHTDYNDGFVMPMAIDYGIWFAVTPRHDTQINLHSLEFETSCHFDLKRFNKGKQFWGEYVKGVAWALQEAGHKLTGWDGYVVGNIPKGAGLSSSAALEVGIAKIFSELSNLNLTPEELATRGQLAENKWVGVNCGIMDQMIIAAGKKHHALLIDCRDLSYKHVPIPSGVSVVVMDTATRRGLVDSAYNERREQCQRAADFYKKSVLRDVDLAQLAEEPQLTGDEFKRAKHVVGENARALDGAKALADSALAEFGALMKQSHTSLKDDFEVSSPALNSIVEIAQATDGCFGARMTGAGFGGSAVALVEFDKVNAFCESVAQKYQKATGLRASIYSSKAAQGTHKLY